jgi:signal transduction histidine kinase
MRDALLNASAEADRLVRLAEDLLVLARIREGRLPVRRIPVDLGALFGNVCSAYEARARAAGATIEWRTDVDVVSVDPSRVRQAMEDLLDNAIRHARGRRVELSGSWTDDGVAIAIRDHGAGFSPQMLGRALEPFAHQAPGGESREQDGSEGAGLGLAIVRAVAEAHGGCVVLENAREGGARVTVTLKVAARRIVL